MMHPFREWYLPSTCLHPPQIHHFLAQTYLACQSPILSIGIHVRQLYSPAITIPIPHFSPQIASQSKLQRIQVISASESGVIISKKREGRRREDHSPSQVANYGVQIIQMRSHPLHLLHTLQIFHVPWDLNLAKYRPHHGSLFGWAIQVIKVC